VGLKTIRLIAVFVLDLVTWAISAESQPAEKIVRIGYLHFRAAPIATDEAFRQALRELGWIEGQNIAIEYRWGAGKRDRYSALAEELVRMKVALIVTATPAPTRAAKNATTTIPIVMASAPFPTPRTSWSNLKRTSSLR